MRKVTKTVITAFLAGEKKNMGNTSTDGVSLFLHGNKIAEKRANGLYITLAGWNSRTTKERLNGLPNVSIYTKNGQTFLNGVEWGGHWTKPVIGEFRQAVANAVNSVK